MNRDAMLEGFVRMRVNDDAEKFLAARVALGTAGFSERLRYRISPRWTTKGERRRAEESRELHARMDQFLDRFAPSRTGAWTEAGPGDYCQMDID